MLVYLLMKDIAPSIAKVSSGEIRRQEWEKSIKNPQEYWTEKAKAIDWFKTLH